MLKRNSELTREASATQTAPAGRFGGLVGCFWMVGDGRREEFSPRLDGMPQPKIIKHVVVVC